MSPNAMHGALWRAINGARGGEEGIGTEKKLDNKLKYWQKKPTGTSPMLIVVLDEIDQLMTENRQVLRKLFQWADAPKSRLVRDLACLMVHTKSLSGRHSTWALSSLFASCLGRRILCAWRDCDSPHPRASFLRIHDTSSTPIFEIFYSAILRLLASGASGASKLFGF